MKEHILAMAQSVTGAGENEQELLAALCEAAERYWTARLRRDAAVEDCAGILCCAAAFTAAADLETVRGGGAVAGFTAGEISVRTRGAAETAGLAEQMRRTAEKIMELYTTPGDFCFQGVQG